MRRVCRELAPGSVNLVVTSPPYPMIEMWDEMFSLLNYKIADSLKCGNGQEAYILMNQELDKVWVEVDRVLASTGMVCINMGDATRKVGIVFACIPTTLTLSTVSRAWDTTYCPL